MRITMKTTASGPNGTYQSERTYATPHEIPLDLAREFVRVGAAVELNPVPPGLMVNLAQDVPETALGRGARKK